MGLNRQNREKRKKRRLGQWGARFKLTYDATLQVISWTAQKDLFLDGGFLRRHLLVFLPAGVETNKARREGRGRGAKRGKGKNERSRKSRTSCS